MAVLDLQHSVCLVCHKLLFVFPTVNSSVQHVISHVLLSLTEDLGSVSTDDYILKVYGLTEYLSK